MLRDSNDLTKIADTWFNLEPKYYIFDYDSGKVEFMERDWQVLQEFERLYDEDKFSPAFRSLFGKLYNVLSNEPLS